MIANDVGGSAGLERQLLPTWGIAPENRDGH